MVIPASFLIVLLAPSQPSTTGPVNVCVSPATRACTRAGAVGSEVTGRRRRLFRCTSAPRRNVISGCCPIRASSSSSRSGWWNMFACGKPCWLGWWSRLNSAMTWWLASSRRSPLPGRDRARKPSATPIRPRVRATSSSRCTARGRGWGWVWRSSRVTGIPESASRRAAVQQAGPAPRMHDGFGGWAGRLVQGGGLSVVLSFFNRDGVGGLGRGRPERMVRANPPAASADPAWARRPGHGDDQPSAFVRCRRGSPGIRRGRAAASASAMAQTAASAASAGAGERLATPRCRVGHRLSRPARRRRIDECAIGRADPRASDGRVRGRRRAASQAAGPPLVFSRTGREDSAWSWRLSDGAGVRRVSWT